MPGSEKGDDGFAPLTRSYKQDPTIENYLRLRRQHPDAEIEVAIIGGVEQLFFLENELRRYGIDPKIVADVMDDNRHAIAEMSLQLMEHLVVRSRKIESGETHLGRRGAAIPDKLVDWLIACALDSLSYNDDLQIPRDLIVLIRERLTGSSPEYERASHANEMRSNAIILGGQLLAAGIRPSYRTIGSMLKVAPSTVKRWFPKGDFLSEATAVATWFDEKGNLRPAAKIEGAASRKK